MNVHLLENSKGIGRSSFSLEEDLGYYSCNIHTPSKVVYLTESDGNSQQQQNCLFDEVRGCLFSGKKANI